MRVDDLIGFESRNKENGNRRESYQVPMAQVIEKRYAAINVQDGCELVFYILGKGKYEQRCAYRHTGI